MPTAVPTNSGFKTHWKTGYRPAGAVLAEFYGMPAITADRQKPIVAHRVLSRTLL